MEKCLEQTNQQANKNLFAKLVTHNVVISFTGVFGREDSHTSQTTVLLKTKQKLRMATTKTRWMFICLVRVTTHRKERRLSRSEKGMEFIAELEGTATI